MATFEDIYDNADSIPAEVKHLYRESDNGFVLVGAGEFKTVDDVARVQEGLRKEREDHKNTKQKLQKFNGIDPDEIHSKLDRFDELEALTDGKMDESKINTMVESRIKSKVAPLERQINNLLGERDELNNKVQTFQVKDTQRKIRDNVQKAATAAKVRDTAVQDVLDISLNLFEVNDNGEVVTRDNVGVTPGVSPEVWLTDAKNTRPHWYPESQGTGARGGNGAGGSNPFSASNWNMTEQGKMYKENPQKAEQMAKSAGTYIGGPKPAK